MKKITFRKVWNFFLDFAIIFAGCIIFATSVVVFSSPNNMVPGGVTGVAILINYMLPALPIGMVTFALNIPLLIWGGIEVGWKYLTKTLLGTVLSSTIIDLMSIEALSGIIKPYTNNPIMVCIFGGLLCGAGMALIFYRGGSTGGTDIVSRILHKRKPHISLGKFMLACDAVVVVMAAVVYGNIENALYAIVFIFVSSKVIDVMIYGFARNNGKLLFIVTANHDEVTELILNNIDRGVTLLEAKGGYRKDDKQVIMCAVRPNQVHLTTQLVHSVDPNAFVIVTTAGTISGEGFESDGIS